MDVRELRAFVTVVTEGGVSAAARTLHVSQSALSQTVRGLERQLGQQLLVRDHTGTRPTAAGLELLRGARDLLDRHDRLLAAMTGTARSGAVVRLGVPLELPADLLPDVLARVGANSPETVLEPVHASSTEQLRSLRAGDLDLALVRDHPAEESFDAVPVLEEALGVMVSSQWSTLLADSTGVPLHRLAALRWIGFPREESPAWHDQITATFRAHGLPDPAEGASRGHSAIAEVKVAGVASGTHFALAPAERAQTLPTGVRWHPLAGSPLVRRTWAVWSASSRSRDLAAVVAAFEDRA